MRTNKVQAIKFAELSYRQFSLLPKSNLDNTKFRCLTRLNIPGVSQGRILELSTATSGLNFVLRGKLSPNSGLGECVEEVEEVICPAEQNYQRINIWDVNVEELVRVKIPEEDEASYRDSFEDNSSRISFGNDNTFEDSVGYVNGYDFVEANDDVREKVLERLLKAIEMIEEGLIDDDIKHQRKELAELFKDIGLDVEWQKRAVPLAYRRSLGTTTYSDLYKQLIKRKHMPKEFRETRAVLLRPTIVEFFAEPKLELINWDKI